MKNRGYEMKQKKKTDFVAILVYLAMISLVAIIVLPPVLRVLLTKNEVEPVQNEKISALMCKKQDSDTNVMRRATATYQNDELMKLTILYSVDEQDDNEENKEFTTETVNPFESISEISNFEKITGVNIVRQENQVKVEISANVFASAPSNENLSKYNQVIEEEQTMFEEDGYTCQVTTSE